MANPSSITTTQFIKALQSENAVRSGDMDVLNLMFNQPNHKAGPAEIAETFYYHFVPIATLRFIQENEH